MTVLKSLDEKVYMRSLVTEIINGESYSYYPLGQYVVRAMGFCGDRPTFKYTRTLLFELLNQPFEEGYEFISVEVKEKAFRFDGIFAPETIDKPIYFVEVQFQKKANFYWEFLSEILLYLSQYEPENDWKAVAIFADRQIAPTKLSNFQQELINHQRLIAIYLDELGESESVAIAIIQLITSPESDAPRIVQGLKQQN